MAGIAPLRNDFEARAEDAATAVGKIDDVLSGRLELPTDLWVKDVCQGWVANLRRNLADLQSLAGQIEAVVDRL